VTDEWWSMSDPRPEEAEDFEDYGFYEPDEEECE